MDQINHILREYDLFPLSTAKIKSVWKIITSRGIFALKQTDKSYEQLQFSADSLHYLAYCGFRSVSPFITNKYGERFIPFEEGFVYLTPWVEGEHGDALFKKRDWIPAVFKAMAKMHQLSSGNHQYPPGYLAEIGKALLQKWQNHLTEVREYQEIANERLYPSPVDFVFIENANFILESANLAMERLQAWIERVRDRKEIRLSFCHGKINPFHLVMTDRPHFINFDRANLDIPARDLAYFTRFLMSQMDTSTEDLANWITLYQEQNPLSEEDFEIFRISMLYPSNLLSFLEHYYRRLRGNKYTEIVLVRHFEKLIYEQQQLMDD